MGQTSSQSPARPSRRIRRRRAHPQDRRAVLQPRPSFAAGQNNSQPQNHGPQLGHGRRRRRHAWTPSPAKDFTTRCAPAICWRKRSSRASRRLYPEQLRAAFSADLEFAANIAQKSFSRQFPRQRDHHAHGATAELFSRISRPDSRRLQRLAGLSQPEAPPLEPVGHHRRANSRAAFSIPARCAARKLPHQRHPLAPRHQLPDVNPLDEAFRETRQARCFREAPETFQGSSVARRTQAAHRPGRSHRTSGPARMDHRRLRSGLTRRSLHSRNDRHDGNCRR